MAFHIPTALLTGFYFPVIKGLIDEKSGSKGDLNKVFGVAEK